jgi:hypothetical protein
LPLLVAGAVFAAAECEAGFGFDAAVHGDGVAVELLLDRGDGAVYVDGDRVHLSLRTSRDAYIVVYGVDVEGRMHLLYPLTPECPRRFRGGVVNVIDAPFLSVGGGDGIVYVQALASAYPLEPYLPDWCFHPHRLPPHRLFFEHGVIRGDPYVGLARFRDLVIPSHCGPGEVGFATVWYSVRAPRQYPRYLCADCHYGDWYDPYADVCVVFEVRIDAWWSDWHRPRRCEPRFYYWKRPNAPVRYRDCKTRWSSKDGEPDLIRNFGGRGGRERRYLSGIPDGDFRRPTVAQPIDEKPGRNRPDGRSPKDRDRGARSAGPDETVGTPGEDRGSVERDRSRIEKPERTPDRGSRPSTGIKPEAGKPKRGEKPASNEARRDRPGKGKKPPVEKERKAAADGKAKAGEKPPAKRR